MNRKSHSRREFFKTSFQKTLPIISLLAIVGLPSIAHSRITNCTDGSCENSCSGSCKGTCSGGCSNECDGCSGTCKGDCAGQCATLCKY